MRGAAFFWGSLYFTVGVQSLSGPGEVIVPFGETLSVTCSYDAGYRSNTKYWCKGASWTYCEIVIESNGQDMVQKGRISIVDNRGSNNFTVTSSSMKPEDSDHYHCGISRSFADKMIQIKVTVLPGVCTATSNWTSMVIFPMGFERIAEGEVVEVSCQEMFENKTFHLKCQKKSDVFQLQPQTNFTPCIRRCRRMADWGQNISMYPQQEYYDRYDEVALTCSEGYEPTHRRIQCVRDNDTNSWNVSKVSCRNIASHGISLDHPWSPYWSRKTLVSWTFGLMAPTAVKLMVVLAILTVRAFDFLRRQWKSNIKQDERVVVSECWPKDNLYQKEEADQQIYQNMIVDAPHTVYCVTPRVDKSTKISDSRTSHYEIQKTGMPRAKGGVSRRKEGVPRGKEGVPRGKEGVPRGKEGVPEEKRVFPEEKKVCPEEKSVCPEKIWVCSEKKRACPENKRVRPEKNRLCPEEIQSCPVENRLCP